MSPAKDKLLNLEQTGQFVFHGTDADIEEFEPRQAFTLVNEEQVPDGEPGVFASSDINYAIVMGIITKANCPKGLHSSVSTYIKDGLEVTKYRASADTIVQLTDDSAGWVYVFDKNLFKKKGSGGTEYVSNTRVRPIEKIKVKKEDLPETLEVL